MDKDQLKSLIDRITTAIGLHSLQSTKLLLGTAAQESGLGRFIRQRGGGPALGIFQMEPATHNYLTDLLAERPALRFRISRYSQSFTAADLEWNLGYAICMARFNYFRCPGPLPDDVIGMAMYWKQWWNSSEGAGTVQQFVSNYMLMVGGNAFYCPIDSVLPDVMEED